MSRNYAFGKYLTPRNGLLTQQRHLLQRGDTSFKSAKPPNGVPWKPAQRSGSSALSTQHSALFIE